MKANGSITTRQDGTTPADPAFKDNFHIIWAADVWHSIKRHWVIELQNFIRARRARTS